MKSQEEGFLDSKFRYNMVLILIMAITLAGVLVGSHYSKAKSPKTDPQQNVAKAPVVPQQLSPTVGAKPAVKGPVRISVSPAKLKLRIADTAEQTNNLALQKKERDEQSQK
jgi:hypothetical protein